MDLYSLDDSLQRLISDELARDERVLWAGQPVPRPGFPWVALAPVLFAIPWTLFSLFWIAGAAGVLDGFGNGNGNDINKLEPGRLVFAMFGVPFVLIGLGMMSSPYWIRRRFRRAAARTAYAITERRALIIDGGYYGDSGMATLVGGMILSRLLGKGINIRSYTPDQLGQVQRVQREDGSGDVIFGEVLFTSHSGGHREMMRSGFFSIPEVKKIEELLKALAASAEPE